ncbi:CCR4-NOT transcription complex subunit 9 [Paragonimus westermani]|uniref:CCR4-NOT transcription complex subunit 9 n=1 Tax=Paragonimus westermani TaxID=34504 RepID=A0A5J4NEI6_9TREM|nr:CCR4-NOT transcription complex subunit 9 [Paragonimus westermani]
MIPLMPSVTSPTGQSVTSTSSVTEMENVYKWISALTNVETRESALLELCKKRESVPELAPLLWNSCGSIAALLQEICAIYPYINPPNLNAHQSNRVCNALALLQCLASHPETRSDFLKANIPLYLYTFLNTSNRTRPFEYLRLTSLGVIGALVKTDESEVITFLLGSEIIPLCLVIMESGSELSKTVATFIMQKLLLDDVGLAYICQTYERFAHVATVLDKMVNHLAKEQSLRLLKHVIRCYLRLSDDIRARDALGSCLPQQLADGTFASLLESDISTKRWLNQLLRQVTVRAPGLTGGNATFVPSSGNASELAPGRRGPRTGYPASTTSSGLPNFTAPGSNSNSAGSVLSTTSEVNGGTANVITCAADSFATTLQSSTGLELNNGSGMTSTSSGVAQN